MSFTVSSGLTQAQGNFTVPEKTINILSARRVAAGTTTLGTVGANKKWYVIGAAVEASTGANSDHPSLQLNAVEILAVEIVGQATGFAAAANSITFPYPQCPTLAAGETITFVTTAVCNASAQIFYVEVSV